LHVLHQGRFAATAMDLAGHTCNDDDNDD
jgi:hypothetical protein